MLAEIRKAVACVVGAAVAWATIVINSKSPGITADEWLVGAIMLATALGVYEIPNAVKRP